MTTIQIDDLDPSITYSGAWQEVEGSTRQWGGGTVHSTTQEGASASITFSGTRIKMYCTLLHGLGNEIAIIDFNGQSSTVSMPSQPTDVFNGVWFDSGTIPTGQYTLIVSNGGGPSDTPLQLDRFSITGLVVSPSASQPSPPTPAAPVPQPPPSPSSLTETPQAPQPNGPTTTQVTISPVTPNEDRSAGAGLLLGSSSSFMESGTPSINIAFMPSGSLTTIAVPGQTTVVSIQSIQNISITSVGEGNSSTQITNTSGSNTPTTAPLSKSSSSLGVVIGGVIGGLLFLLLLLLICLFLRRKERTRRHVLLPDGAPKVDDRPRSLTAVTPFHLDAPSPQSLVSLMSDVHTFYSPPSSFFAARYLSDAPHDTRRRSIDKLPLSASDVTQHPTLANGTTITFMNNADPHSRDAILQNPQGVGSGPHALHYQVGNSISSSISSSFYMPIQDSNDVPRPPSYHLIQIAGN